MQSSVQQETNKFPAVREIEAWSTCGCVESVHKQLGERFAVGKASLNSRK